MMTSLGKCLLWWLFVRCLGCYFSAGVCHVSFAMNCEKQERIVENGERENRMLICLFRIVEDYVDVESEIMIFFCCLLNRRLCDLEYF
jgi:hypothetical protein